MEVSYRSCYGFFSLENIIIFILYFFAEIGAFTVIISISKVIVNNISSKRKIKYSRYLSDVNLILASRICIYLISLITMVLIKFINKVRVIFRFLDALWRIGHDYLPYILLASFLSCIIILIFSNIYSEKLKKVKYIIIIFSSVCIGVLFTIYTFY